MAKAKKSKKVKAARKPSAKRAKRPHPAKAPKAKAPAKRKPTVHPGVGAGRPSRLELLMGEEIRKLRVVTFALLAATAHAYNDGKSECDRILIGDLLAIGEEMDGGKPAKPKDVATEVMEMAQKAAAGANVVAEKPVKPKAVAEVPAAKPGDVKTSLEKVVESIDRLADKTTPLVMSIAEPAASAPAEAEPIAPSSPAPWMAPAPAGA